MYRAAYSEFIEDSAEVVRERERAAFDHIIDLMEQAQAPDAPPESRTAAISGVQSLWTVLIDDLCQTDNALPEALRADLISIGLWVLRASDQILRGAAESFEGLIAVNANIRDGLK